MGATAVVLCALPLEYQAVRPLLANLQVKELPGGTLLEEGVLPGTPWQVALGQLGEGNVGAGILAERAMRFFLPDLVLFVGIAGGLKDDVLVGDVVIATRIDAYQGGKMAEDFLARPRTWDADHRLEQRARHLAVTGGWPPAGLIRVDGAPPAVHFKPIAAGDVVLTSRDNPLYKQLRLHYNDAVAIEMEGAGLAQAAHINDALPALVIRGISDTTGPDKQELDAAGWQPRAASHAASFAAALLRSLPPGSLHRRQVSDVAQTAANQDVELKLVEKKVVGRPSLAEDGRETFIDVWLRWRIIKMTGPFDIDVAELRISTGLIGTRIIEGEAHKENEFVLASFKFSVSGRAPVRLQGVVTLQDSRGKTHQDQVSAEIRKPGQEP